MRQRTKNQFSTLVLILVLLFLTIGYAYLSANLKINGTSSIKNATWDIHFDNVQVTEGSVEAETPVIDTTKTTVSYDVTLNKPGDFYEFTVDAVNAGTIDAMIESITSTINDESIDNLPSYMIYQVIYGDNRIIENNHLIRAGETETYKIRIEYKKDISASDLPTTNEEYSFTFTLNKVQANSNAFERKKYLDVEDLKALAVPSGEGLSLSTYEENRYIYRGANPDNYIQLGEDMYRIIAIESDNTVKVVKKESIGQIVYDIGNNEVEGLTRARLSSTESGYCSSIVGGIYLGCNAWGSNTTTLDESGNPVTTIGIAKSLPDNEAYLNVYLNGGTYSTLSKEGWYNTLPNDVRNIIVNHIFNVGYFSIFSTDLSSSINSQKEYQWNGKVALITPIDFVLANSNVEQCGTPKESSRLSSNIETCKQTNWISTEEYSVLLSGYGNGSSGQIVNTNGNGCLTNGSALAALSVKPSFFLTSSLKLTGEGTETNPYKLYQAG